MIKIKKEKIAAMMFDIWKESDKLTNLLMVDEYIANKINEAINDTHCSKSDSKLLQAEDNNNNLDVEEITQKEMKNHMRRMRVESGWLYNFWNNEKQDYETEWVFVPKL